jgi:hypothetical protein
MGEDKVPSFGGLVARRARFVHGLVSRFTVILVCIMPTVRWPFLTNGS